MGVIHHYVSSTFLVEYGRAVGARVDIITYNISDLLSGTAAT